MKKFLNKKIVLCLILTLSVAVCFFGCAKEHGVTDDVDETLSSTVQSQNKETIVTDEELTSAKDNENSTSSKNTQSKNDNILDNSAKDKTDDVATTIASTSTTKPPETTEHLTHAPSNSGGIELPDIEF